MDHIGIEERRRRIARRHRLARGALAVDPVDVARDLVGLHATDPAGVFLALRARMADPSIDRIEAALYEERSLLRMLGMRRTMFVEPLDLAAIVQAAATTAVADQQRALTCRLIAEAGVPGDPGAWLADVEASTLRALGARGEALANELSADEPRLGLKLSLAAGKRYAAEVNIVTRVLLQLAADGRIGRGRPRGSWISSQYRWAPIEAWFPDGMPRWEVEAARAELVRRWLRTFGPGTPRDIRWWTGWALRDVKRALAAIGSAEVRLDEGPAVVLADDLDPTPDPGPWIALLPALDPTVMGWSERGWYLGPHRPALFDTNGNAGPTVWSDGRVVGGWAQRRDGEIAVRLLGDVGREASAAIDEEAAALRDWIGPVRVTPRFRTPLERELGG